MNYNAYVVGILDAKEEAGVVTIDGRVMAKTYTYTLEVESVASTDHPSLIKPSQLTIRSAEQLNWRVGQNINFEIKPIEPELDNPVEF